MEIVFLETIEAHNMDKSSGSSIPFLYRKKFLFLPFWPALNIFLLKFILYMGIKTCLVSYLSLWSYYMIIRVKSILQKNNF